MAAIAIDGPAGAGKSTVARAVAERLGFTYVDTGAMYRAVALCVLESDVDPTDPGGVSNVATTMDLDLRDGRVLVDGNDVGEDIRSGRVTKASAEVARHPGVREVLVAAQRRVAMSSDVVMEGRDIGSKVLPEAELKVFLTASLDERARRRARDVGVHKDAELEELKATIEARDETDSKREIAPLVRPPDAVEVDTTGRTIDEVVDEIVGLAEERLR